MALFLAALLAGAAGCTRSEPVARVTLTIEAGALATRPAYLRLSWLDGRGYLFSDRRVPRTGWLPETDPLAEIHIDSDVRAPEERVAVVRAFARDDRLLGEAAAVVLVYPGARLEKTLSLTPGSLPDRDRDRIPDAVDRCPDDPAPGATCAPGPDGRGPLAPDAAPAPAEPDAGAERPAPADAPPPATDLATPSPDAPPRMEAGAPDRPALPPDAAPAPPDTAPDRSPPPDAEVCPGPRPDLVVAWSFENRSLDTFAFDVQASQQCWRYIPDSGNHRLGIEPLPEPRCGSRYALRYTASGFSGWGSGIGAYIVPRGAGGAPGFYDARAFRGIRFLARANAPTGGGFKVSDANTHTGGGLFGRSVRYGTDWQEIVLPFSELRPDKAGAVLDSSRLYALEFFIDAGGPWELWIDEIGFIK